MADDSGSFLGEHGPALGAGAALLVALAAAALLLFGQDERAVRKVPEVMMVRLQPLPPPPPPPPPKPVETPKMVEQTPVRIAEPKPERPLDKPLDKPLDRPKSDEPPPGPLALDAKAEGPGDSFGLAGREGGAGILGGGGGGGSRWGWYAAIVQAQVEEALRANRKTRAARARVEVRLWADPAGRVTRVQMSESTGDAEIDDAIRTEVLGGLVLKEPPPREMPMPIVARLVARRPS